MARRILIAGNWKMNKTATEAVALVNEIKREVYDVDNVDILVCPPFTALSLVSDVVNESNIALGAQNMYFEESGAYTGEVSTAMLKDCGCTHVIIGHSERRTIFNESDELINKKVKKALEADLTPVLCIGEKLEEREANKTFEVITNQLNGDLADIDSDNMKKIVIAYEPVWAIGTGKTATPQQAQEAHAFIRKLIKEKYDEAVANETIILYGGSMKPANVEELIAQEDVDGGLIGGASLKAESFVEMIKKSNKE
jgi:triosephosphate isomerase